MIKTERKKSKFTRGTTRAATLKAIAHVDADWTSETSQYNKENKSFSFLLLLGRCQKHFMTCICESDRQTRYNFFSIM